MLEKENFHEKKQHCLLLHYSVHHSLMRIMFGWSLLRMQKGNMWLNLVMRETETYPQSKLKAVRLLDAKGQLQNATVNFKEGEALLPHLMLTSHLFALIMVFGQNYQAVNM